jgi:DNA-binding NarL/FixJ family response regulator
MSEKLVFTQDIRRDLKSALLRNTSGGEHILFSDLGIRREFRESEFRIMYMICQGKSGGEIAKEFGGGKFTEQKIRKHFIEGIFGKIGVSNLNGFFNWAGEHIFINGKRFTHQEVQTTTVPKILRQHYTEYKVRSSRKKIEINRKIDLNEFRFMELPAGIEMTREEMKIAYLLFEGLSNKKIALELLGSESKEQNIKNLLRELYDKMKFKERMSLVRWVAEHLQEEFNPYVKNDDENVKVLTDNEKRTAALLTSVEGDLKQMADTLGLTLGCLKTNKLSPLYRKFWVNGSKKIVIGMWTRRQKFFQEFCDLQAKSAASN